MEAISQLQDFLKLSQEHVAYSNQTECPCTVQGDSCLPSNLEFNYDFYSYKNVFILELHLEMKQFNEFPFQILVASFAKDSTFSLGFLSNHKSQNNQTYYS